MIATTVFRSTAFSGARVLGKSQLRNMGKSLLTIRGGSTSSEDKPFFTFGVIVSRQLGSQLGGLKELLSKEEMDVFLQGLGEGIRGEVAGENELFQKYGPEIERILSARASATVNDEKQRGVDFVNKYLLSNPKAVKTPSGLIYHEIIAGTGEKPTSTSEVTVHYTGTLTNGKVFDSSVARGKALTFPLNGVIKGWQEGVAMMQVGGKATLVVPSDLAYGDEGSAPVIPGGATLQFEVELIEVAKAAK